MRRPRNLVRTAGQRGRLRQVVSLSGAGADAVSHCRDAGPQNQAQKCSSGTSSYHEHTGRSLLVYWVQMSSTNIRTYWWSIGSRCRLLLVLLCKRKNRISVRSRNHRRRSPIDQSNGPVVHLRKLLERSGKRKAKAKSGKTSMIGRKYKAKL